MNAPLEHPETVLALAGSRWDRVLRAWMRGEEVPLRVPVRGGTLPTRDVLRNLPAYRAWIRAWETVPHVSWKRVRKGALGEVPVPVCVTPPTIDAYADWVGTGGELARVRSRLDALSRYGADPAALARVRSDLAEMGREEFGHLLALLDWRRGCPDPVRARDVPLIGVGSKWVENRIGLIEPVLAACGLTRDGSDRFERCGLLRGSGARLPIRFHPGDFPVLDLDCDPTSLIGWPERVHTLLVLENEAPFRTLLPRPGYALAWGCGHAARATLPGLPAASGLRLIYWGDCDSHGYAILDALRADLPRIRSVGMGLDTVLAWQDRVIPEAPSERVTTGMPRLTNAEAAARSLLLDRRGRLEQERVPVPEGDLFPDPV